MQIDNSICAWRRRSAYVGDIIFGAVGEIIGCPRTSGMAAGERGCGGALCRYRPWHEVSVWLTHQRCGRDYNSGSQGAHPPKQRPVHSVSHKQPPFVGPGREQPHRSAKKWPQLFLVRELSTFGLSVSPLQHALIPLDRRPEQLPWLREHW
jgi:hypothetical protein